MNLEELYRQVIMDHYKNPRNKGLVNEDGYHLVHLHNPSCGDDMRVVVKVENGIITDVRQDGKGCSICCSSASVMTESLKGKKVAEANEIIQDFYKMIQGLPISENQEELLGEAIAYKGVSQFPARIKCATLAWKACEQALKEVEEKDE